MKKNNQNTMVKSLVMYGILIAVMIAAVYYYSAARFEKHDFTYDQFIKELSEDKVEELTITPSASSSIYEIEGKLKDYKKTEKFVLKVPYSESVMTKILTYQESMEFKVNTNKDPGSSAILAFTMNVIPTVLLIGATIYLLVRISSGNNKSMDFGRSTAKLNADGGKVKFSDVAGLKEEKEEVSELIDFLKNPKKFQKLGARIPKGVLLVGPPGTGKTLLAKAVAGEANVPFYYISGSDFVELFVGVGASRVRDMFKEAKHNAPCLIFIDEIDAVGRQRGTGIGGGHDEREQTLNQLLTEMDGFGANEGIIIIAATNRPDVLDPALLRPGRFDRQVTVGYPDAEEREAILEVHARNKKFASDVNIKNLSKRTPGFSGADLENLLNEAALLTVRRNKQAISMNEIDEATDRVLMGPAKVSRKITAKEKKLVSLHEAGHAVIGLKLEDAQDVHKITIIPRGMAGGYTMMLPKDEHMNLATKKELTAQIIGLLGGRVSEELFFGEISTGASDDFSRATKIARAMVTEYGMSDLGPIQFESKQGSVFLGRDYDKAKNFSDQVALEIDTEVRKIIDACYKEATKILKENKKLVTLISETLIEHETITKEEIEELVTNGKLEKYEKKDNESKKHKDE